MGGFFSRLFGGGGEVGANPTIQAIEEEANRKARAEAEGRIREETDRINEEFNKRIQEFDERKAQDDLYRQQAQEETNRRIRENDERRAQDEIDRRKAQEETNNARQAQGIAEKVAAEAAEKERTAKVAQEQAERAAKEAEKKTNEAKAAQIEAEKKWKEGIQPEVWPTAQELAAAKKRHQYTEGLFHFAVAGVAGSGKSSLINAIRGLSNNSRGAAPTGVTETTAAITRYPDSKREQPFVWYDVPGAGTLKIPDWEYFNNQGLYIFDCIIVLFDNRFTSTDVAILKNCARFKIPSYIVRSKSNQHIRNVMEDMGYTSDDDDDRRAELYVTARDQFIMDTRRSVYLNLIKAQLPQQRAYIVAKDALLGIVNDKKPKSKIDEVELIKDLLADARARRNATTAVYHPPSPAPPYTST